MKVHFDWIAGFGVHMSYNTEKHKVMTFFPNPVSSFVIFHIENNEVVQDVFQSLNYSTFKGFEDIEIPTKENFIVVPNHRTITASSIFKNKEPMFLVPDTLGEYTLYIHGETVDFRNDGMVKNHVFNPKKPSTVTNRTNYTIVQQYHTCFRDFTVPILTDYNEYCEINQYYKRAIEHWRSVGPTGVVGLEDEIKIMQLQVNELKAAMSRWEVLDPADLLRKNFKFLEFPNVIEPLLGVKDFWGFKGDEGDK